MTNQSTNHAATVDTFGGFALPEDSTNCKITMPTNWPEVAKAIDNLAELKVVQLILWVTWGNGQADALMPLTLDDIAECTSLSQQSVRTGIDKAIQHGYIVREIEYNTEDGRVHQIRFYGIKLYQVDIQEQDLSVPQDVSVSDESAIEADCYEAQEVSAFSNELEIYPHNNNSVDISRIQEEDNTLDTDQSKRSCNRLQLLSRDDNATLCNRIESLSRALGDHEHIASNIGQTRHILARYLASGGEFEAFLLLMYDVQDIARRKTNMRRPNRMPYFFACLKRACKEMEKIAA